MDIDKIIAELEDWTAFVTESEDILKSNKAGRDEAIREAITSHVRVSGIVKATGLTRGRVYQIKANPRPE
jgi:hypothetical protein